MIEAFIVTVLTVLVVVWVGFSMLARDEARVSANVDLNKWYQTRTEAKVYEIEELELKREYVSLRGRGEHVQKGYRLELEYRNTHGEIQRTVHTFYDDSEQDEAFLGKYVKNDKLYVWLAKDNDAYIPGEIIENSGLQVIFGADRVLTYAIISAILAVIVSSVFVLMLSPFWIVLHIPLVILSAFVPQIIMYLQELGSNVKRVGYQAVGALHQYGVYVDESKEGVDKYKLVEQTLPIVLLDSGDGYLGYQPDGVKVLVDYEGNIPVHISSEYHISDFIKEFIDKLRKK